MWRQFFKNSIQHCRQNWKGMCVCTKKKSENQLSCYTWWISFFWFWHKSLHQLHCYPHLLQGTSEKNAQSAYQFPYRGFSHFLMIKQPSLTQSTKRSVIMIIFVYCVWVINVAKIARIPWPRPWCSYTKTIKKTFFLLLLHLLLLAKFNVVF